MLSALGEEVLPELLEMFRASFPKRMAALEAAAAKADHVALERLAHALRSSAGQIGLTRLESASRQVEEGAHGSTADELAAAAGRLAAELREARQLLPSSRPLEPAPRAASPTPTRAPRVLVVEDEAHIARFLEHVLRRAGYSVTWAEVGSLKRSL